MGWLSGGGAPGRRCPRYSVCMVAGRNLGNYEIIGKLGEGGMGEVWRARDRRLQRNVAVKVLSASAAADPSRRARFEQEARRPGALNHPNVVAVYDVGEDGGIAYLVSERVEGASLHIAIQMADGIAAAHALGIIHRDLKPEDAMVTPSGQVKLLDFGLAKQDAPAAGENTATVAIGLSEPGMVMQSAHGIARDETVIGWRNDNRSAYVRPMWRTATAFRSQSSISSPENGRRGKRLIRHSRLSQSTICMLRRMAVHTPTIMKPPNRICTRRGV